LTAAPAGGGSLAHRSDPTDPTTEKVWADATVERFGRIDAVVANAGIMIPKTVIEADDDDIDALMQVNVKSPLRLVRAAWPWLTASGRGRVITIASLSGKRVKSAKSATYAISKFAAVALTHSIRHAGWDQGIRATAICPGFVATDMSAALTDRAREDITQPEDVARIVAFVLDLPNTSSITEVPINSTLEDML
jgi:NAD(P)-dependent dehydrogenase (short-subunit alcohol dehydrogenase family)